MNTGKKNNSFQTYHQKQLENDVFREEFENLQPFRAIAQAVIDSGLTEEEIANRSGLSLSTIRKLENGTINPSVRTLQRFAAGLGKTLQITYISPAGTSPTPSSPTS